jgi:hypothetical protein
MKWTKFALIFLLDFVAFSWAQESSADAGSIAQGTTPPQTELSSLPTSLLWQIGSDALQSSLQHSMTSGETLDKVLSSQDALTQLSRDIFQISQRLEQKTSSLSSSFDSLSTSITSSVDSTIKALTQLQKQVQQQNLELWIWRTATAIAVIYLILR